MLHAIGISIPQSAIFRAAQRLHPEALYSFDFTTGTYFGAAESDFVVTRASPGLAQDLSGNWVSFGNNVMRRTNRGLLVEEARTNLFLNSNAPATQSITVVNGTVYTVSLHGTGSAALSGAGAGTATNGSPVTFTASSTSLTVTITGSPTYVQVEAGSFATSPIITAGSPITREADSMSLAIPALSGAYSVLAIGTANAPNPHTSNQNFVQMDELTDTQRWVIRKNTTGAYLSTLVGGAGAGFAPSGTWLPGVRTKFAGGIQANSQAAVFNGGTPGTATAATLPNAPTRIRLGSNSAGTESFNGIIEGVAVVPRRLSNAELQAWSGS